MKAAILIAVVLFLGGCSSGSLSYTAPAWKSGGFSWHKKSVVKKKTVRKSVKKVRKSKPAKVVAYDF